MIYGNLSALAEVCFKTSLFVSSLKTEDKMGGERSERGRRGERNWGYDFHELSLKTLSIK